MSYCRFGADSDVYLFYCHGVECCGCRLKDSTVRPIRMEYKVAIAHVKEHIAAGDLVPDHVIPSLEEELEDGK